MSRCCINLSNNTAPSILFTPRNMIKSCIAASFALALSAYLSVNLCKQAAAQPFPESEQTPHVGGKNSTGQIPRYAKILMDCYPDYVKGYKDNYLIMSDGSKILYDDGQQKTPIERLDHADIEDMFYFTYRRERPTDIRNDAGRCRNERLFKYMYGSTPAEVRKQLVKVPWNGSYVLFSKVNGAAAALAAVNRELQQHPELKKYLVSSGTFNWRYIRGTKRLSSHAFATAIDIGVAKYADYWKNSGLSEASTQLVYRNRMPLELAKIFEKHGFIWGGYWYHYDTMHFEYHPEIIAANP